jgi:hypothetical protein
MILTRACKNHREVKPAFSAIIKGKFADRIGFEMEKIMRGTVLYGSRDIRFEDVPEPKIEKPLTQSFVFPSPVFVGRTYGHTEVYSP